MTIKSQKYRVTFPLDAEQAEHIDTMFEDLYRQLSISILKNSPNFSTFVAGDILYFNSTPAMDGLNDVAVGNALLSGGVGIAPLWGKINLTTTVTATLPVGNGGTGLTTFAQGDLIYGSATAALSALAKDANASRYLSNTGASNNPAWAQVNLTNGVSGDLPYASFVQATAASKLVGRGSAGGAGDFQEITLGSGLTMTATTLSASGSSSVEWSVLANGDTTSPELIFAGGDVIMTSV